MTHEISQQLSRRPTSTTQAATVQLQDASRESSVRAAVAALVLVVISALAIFPFILPSIPV